MPNRLAILVRLAVLLAAVLAAPAFAQGSRSTLRFVSPYDAATLDPVASVLVVTQQHAYLIYDTLFSLDAAGRPQPQMVESYSLDGSRRIYTMVLRPKLQFHDGTPVRAVDAVASIDRWAKVAVVGRQLRRLGLAVHAVDDSTFTVATDVPTPLVLEGFARQLSIALFVMREQDALTEPTKPVPTHIGSGPFRLVEPEYVPGTKVVYERNIDYVPRSEPPSYLAGGKVVHIDRLEFITIADASTAAAAIQTGEVDVWDGAPLDLLPLMRRHAALGVRFLNNGGVVALMRPNHLHPPFNNVKARQALLAATDQEEAMQIAAGDQPETWRRCFSFLGCSSPNATDAGMEMYRTPDLELARRLLQESGYQGEPVLLMQPLDRAPYAQLTLLVAERLRQVGFSVQLVANDWATIAQRRFSRAAPSQGGWSGFITQAVDLELASPAANVLVAAPCDRTGWFGWPCDDKLEALRSAWSIEFDPARRRSLERDMQLRSAEFVPYVPMGAFYTPVIFRTSVTGLMETPVTVFWNVKLAP